MNPAWAPTTQAELPTIQKTVESGAAIHNMGIPGLSTVPKGKAERGGRCLVRDARTLTNDEQPCVEVLRGNGLSLNLKWLGD